MKCEDVFFQKYRAVPEGTAFCPYRICPIGAHVDHNLGKVTGFALDKGVYIAYSADPDGHFELSAALSNTLPD